MLKIVAVFVVFGIVACQETNTTADSQTNAPNEVAVSENPPSSAVPNISENPPPPAPIMQEQSDEPASTVLPTRVPSVAPEASSFPPLVHVSSEKPEEKPASTTKKPEATTTTGSKDVKKGDAAARGFSVVLIALSACVLRHLN